MMATEDKKEALAQAMAKAKLNTQRIGQERRGKQEEQEQWLKTHPQFGPKRPAEMRTAEPESWRDIIARGGGTLANLISGKNKSEATRDVQSMLSVADFLPYAGDILGGADVGSDIERGDIGGAGIGAAAMLIPFVGAKGLKKFIRGEEGLDDIEEGRDALTATITGGGGGGGGGRRPRRPPKTRIEDQPAESYDPNAYDPYKPRNPAEERAKKGKKPTAKEERISLRDKPLDEAIEIAKTEPHLKENKPRLVAQPYSTKYEPGGFVGGPWNAQTREDLQMIRDKFDADVAAGAAGSDWYERAQKWIIKVAGPDPQRQSELARNLALFSAQSDPKTNLGFSIQARNAAVAGRPLDKVRTGQQARTYNAAFEAQQAIKDQIMGGIEPGENLINMAGDIHLGPKTGIYGGHMDPTRENPTTGTNDIWHARAMGYTNPKTGQPWSAALSDTQHNFLDYETVLAVDRANQMALGGRTDWTPGEIQAAPWITGKAGGLEATRGMSPEEAMAEASKTYPDYAEPYLAQGTHEVTPGKATGHLPAVASGSQEARDVYGAEHPWWTTEEGRDAIYDALGMYVEPSKQSIGIYGDEFNPGMVAQPYVNPTGPTGKKVLAGADRELMDVGEAFRALFGGQEAGAWSMAIPGQQLQHSNAFALNLPADMQNREGLAKVIAQAKMTDAMPDVVHYGGEDALRARFYPEPDPMTRQSKAAQTGEMAGIGVGATPVRKEGGYIPYTQEQGFEVGGVSAPGWEQEPGSDTLTKSLLERLTPQMEKQLDQSPILKQKIMQQLDYDIAQSERLQSPVREDLQNLRRAYAAGGIQAIKDAIGQGMFPAFVAAPILGYMLQDQGAETTGGAL